MKINHKSYSRILKAVYLFFLFQFVYYINHYSNIGISHNNDYIHREMYKKCLKKKSSNDNNDLNSNMTLKFFDHDDNTTTGEILTIKPIMHTYIESNEYVDKELLDFWMTSWKDAGWETRILLPRDALNHTSFGAFNNVLQKNKVCCLPRQTYLRHLAMSTIKEGGFYSEAYVFPLRSDLYLQAGQNVSIPNQGNFTSWDGIQGSLMSGSYNEWNRMTQLLMEKIKKNVVLSLMEISDESCDTYNHENLISDPTMLLSIGQFSDDMCKLFNDYLAIRFHPHEIVRHGIDLKDRYSIVSSWFKIHKARCANNDRPIVFTFYEHVSQLDEEQPRELLEVWTQSWYDAGWEPVVLTMGDAKRHPNYKYFQKVLNNHKQFRNNRDRYNYYCFMRWVAISASGGGWLVDYDTFPLNLPATTTLPNHGQFTGHSDYVPNILSGSLTEWNRMIKILFNQLEKQNNKRLFYSDMLAAQDIYFSPENNNDNNNNSTTITKPSSLFITETTSGQLYDFYTEEIANPNTRWKLINPYDFKNKCHLSKMYTTIHFSHHSCGKMWFCRDGVHEGIDGNFIKQQRRGEIAKKWLEWWKFYCGDEVNKLF